MPSDFAMKAMNTFHKSLLTVTFGKVGWRAGGMPVLKLRTKGRKSGVMRESMLTSPVQLGDSIVVVASRGGDPVHPAWFLNLEADPNVEVVYKGKGPMPMKARVAEGTEREEIWQQILAHKPHYGGYQKKTERQIPLVVLDPVRN